MACSQGPVLRLLAYLQCWILIAAASNGGTQQDGLGLAYAESCQAKLFAYRNASLSYFSAEPSRTSYFTGTIVHQSYAPGTTSIASLTTLCDGHPRVVGPKIRTQGPPTNITSVYTNTNIYAQSTGFVQPPCSIGPQDCQLLWSSWTSAYQTATTAAGFAGLLSPPCTTSRQSFSYSTNLAGRTCDNCLVAGSKARLLYWPITTIPGSGDLCNRTAITIPGTPTADGPNTFVTAGVTITSPTVAVSIAGLSRVDGCGTTIATTILPVNPEEVQSVRGNRALFNHLPFNFADLNWRCPDGEYLTDTGHHNCYQEVPAAAYFDGTENWVGLDAMGVNWQTQKNLTIWNDYHPQLLPPKTMSDEIQSIWGNNCYIHPDGIWDPPIALQQAQSIELPVYTPARSTISQQAPTTTAAPGTYTAEYASQTTTDGSATANQEAPPSESDSPYVSTGIGSYGSGGASYAGQGQSESSVSNPSSNSGDANSNESAQNGGSGLEDSPSKQVIVIHSVTFTRHVSSDGADVWTNAHTYFTIPKETAGSAPVVVISQETYTVSAASNGGSSPTSGSGSEPEYIFVGDGTTYSIKNAQSSSKASDESQSTSSTAEGDDTTATSDRRSGPTSTESTGNAATTQGSSRPSSSATFQNSSTPVLPVPLSILTATVYVFVVLALQSG
ncbi:hypothetical protein DOTSEDRAFT_74090 [Dothistroma septosporum NZE10]|uniref:Uncharacterized protein n=1 Tax=Dothistroma septosporum (strain NZE10 / CBS 128990) TaxID=675120 RepID=N1PIH1_DOTSN|nr:hypothetical protein DOTSEDRAFT_74090 [Dothistroma septosporum NZE10]